MKVYEIFSNNKKTIPSQMFQHNRKYLPILSGFLTIPFAEINEKFEAYYDEESGNSRIDYYDGMDKTYQLSNNGEFGKMLKIVPMTDGLFKI